MADAKGWWDIAATLAAAVSAGAAAYEIHRSRHDANRRATLEQLQRADAALQPLYGEPDLRRLQTDVIAHYSDPEATLSDSARRYLSLLNTLDLFALAAEKRLVDRELALEHLQTLMRTHVVSISFLREFQNCCGDAAIYEHLYRLCVDANARRRLPMLQRDPSP